MQRLRLKPEKIKQLGAGLRSIAAQDEPIGKTLSRMEITQGLELEKVGFFLSFFLLFLFRQSDLAIPMSLFTQIGFCGGLLGCFKSFLLSPSHH